MLKSVTFINLWGNLFPGALTVVCVKHNKCCKLFQCIMRFRLLQHNCSHSSVIRLLISKRKAITEVFCCKPFLYIFLLKSQKNNFMEHLLKLSFCSMISKWSQWDSVILKELKWMRKDDIEEEHQTSECILV